MDRIIIKDVFTEGIHGATYKEKIKPQAFRCSVVLYRLSRLADYSDDIESTSDYRKPKDIILQTIRLVKKTINQTQFNLLETLAEKIAKSILALDTIQKVDVTLKKIHIWGNGVPGVSITRHKHPAHLGLLDFNIEWLINELSRKGGASMPILPDERRLQLLKEARSLEYITKPKPKGSLVKEELSSCTTFHESSLFVKLRDDFSQLWWHKLNEISPQPIFLRPFFNEMSIQKYPAGSIGITPHKDGASRTNMVCVFVLDGKAEFSICADRSGDSPISLKTDKGNVIILRAPGFLGGNHQPFHYVTTIPRERFVFRLIQREPLPKS